MIEFLAKRAIVRSLLIPAAQPEQDPTGGFMGNELTPIGKFLRKLRIDAGERIADMARALRCTSSFISAVELGKRSPPDDFLQGVISHYKLDEAQERELRSLAVKSTSAVRIDLSQGGNELSRELAVAFARAFPNIDSEQAAALLTTLNGARGPSRR